MNSSINNNVNLGGLQKIIGTKEFEQTIKQLSDIPYNQNPSGTTDNGLSILDVNNYLWAAFSGIQYTSGTNRAQMLVRGKSGTSKVIYVQENESGDVTYSYGQTMGTKWIKFPRGAGNAVLLCWGNVSAASQSTSKTITFPTAFNDIPFVGTNSNGGSAQVYQNVVSTVSTTNAVVLSSGGSASQGFLWFAIGTADL